MDRNAWQTEVESDIAALETSVSGLAPLTGTATPEGAVTAAVGRFYIDTDAAAGAVLYVKQTGSGNTGWVAVNA